MKSLQPIRALYGVAAAYDGLLGLAFIVAAPQIYAWVGITPPNHWGYIHFAAGMLVIFGYMFLEIARRPVENRNLVPYGILLKFCYIATVAWHWSHGGIPDLWKVLRTRRRHLRRALRLESDAADRTAGTPAGQGGDPLRLHVYHHAGSLAEEHR